jgi:hypothetical protein
MYAMVKQELSFTIPGYFMDFISHRENGPWHNSLRTDGLKAQNRLAQSNVLGAKHALLKP